MTMSVLLDTNLLIAAYDDEGSTSPEEKQKAQVRMNELLDGDKVLYISPLIRYETLRGVTFENNERYRKVKQALDQLPQLEITTDVSELAADLFRFDRQAPQEQRRLANNPDKYRFDVFHFACAQCNGMVVATLNVNDFNKIDDLHTRYQAAKGA